MYYRIKGLNLFSWHKCSPIKYIHTSSFYSSVIQTGNPVENAPDTTSCWWIPFSLAFLFLFLADEWIKMLTKETRRLRPVLLTISSSRRSSSVVVMGGIDRAGPRSLNLKRKKFLTFLKSQDKIICLEILLHLSATLLQVISLYEL